MPSPATGVTAGTVSGGGGWDDPPLALCQKSGADELLAEPQAEEKDILELKLRVRNDAVSLGLPSPIGKQERGEEDAEVEWTPAITLPAEGPVTRQPWLTPAYQGWGVERVSWTGDKARTGLSTPTLLCLPHSHLLRGPQPLGPHSLHLHHCASSANHPYGRPFPRKS